MQRPAISTLLLTCAVAACQAQAAAPAKRFMPFLSRDAVVRESQEKTVLAGPGRAPVILIGQDARGPRRSFENNQIARGAKVLAQCVEKITGVKCRVAADGTAKPEGGVVHIGAGGNSAELFPELAQADAHGFVIATRGGDLYIVGASGTGALYGVWFFLMNYAGVRQVLPGDIGRVCPRSEHLEIPHTLYVLNPRPDFLLRIWSGNSGLDQEAWLADTNAGQRFEYHHAAGRIYDPARFGQTHPEYFPVLGGQPVVPPGGMAGWQPTFSEPASVERAIAYATEFFKASPWMRSVSVTVNDGGGYSERDYHAAERIPGGQGRLSDVYFDYVNRVARGIRRDFPDKYVSCLAYMAVEAPPAFALEDNVLLFALNEPKQIVGQWDDKARHWGIYLWLYGNNWWVIPNHWPHALQDSLRWMRAHGFEAFKGEIYGRWAQDAPKTWVLNNLLWNTDADVDALLKDYYEHAYGVEAAPAVARYFAQAEAVYERRRTPQRYNFVMDQRRGGYRPHEQQFADITPDDVRIMDGALNEAHRVVCGEDNRKRLSYLESCFDLWRSFWEQYRTVQYLQTVSVASDAGVNHALKAATDFYDYPRRRETLFRERIEPNPQFCYFAKAPDARITLERVESEFPWTLADHAISMALESVSAYQRKVLTPAEAARFWDGVTQQHFELARAVRLQRIYSVYPGRPFKTAIGDGTVGAAVNAEIVAELSAPAKTPLTPAEILRLKDTVAKKLAEAGALAGANEVGPQAGRIAICNRSAAPAIDGKLDDPVWRNAAVTDGFFAARTFDAARYRTEVRLLHDDENLYVGVRAWQDTRGLRAAVRFRDMKVWDDDSVELMLCDPVATQPAAGYHIILNALGTVYDQFDGQAERDGRVLVATSVDPEGYTVEFSVPLKDAGVDLNRSRFMRVNFARGAYLPGKIDRLNPWDELSTWYPHQGNNLDPRFMGWMVFNSETLR